MREWGLRRAQGHRTAQSAAREEKERCYTSLFCVQQAFKRIQPRRGALFTIKPHLFTP